MMNDFLCGKKEADSLLQKAVVMSEKIIEELKVYFDDDFEITPFIQSHVLGYSIACDFKFNSALVKTYDLVDLCFLDLNELMLRRLMKERFGRLENEAITV